METTNEKLSINVEGYPRIFKDDLDSQLEKDVFDQILRKTSEQRQLNLKQLEAGIIIRGLFDTLVGLIRKEEEPKTEEE
jgi:hypothetical protein|tara:strand:+ start:70 stop:306 length:237 start_codon:yes stop_codon:yes gene_type:complete